MDHKKFIGTGTAIVTPFRNDGSVDFQSLEKLIDYLISNQVNYLVVLGTTGESVTLNKDEKNAVVSFVIEKVENRVPVVVGCGGNNTQQVINNLRELNFEGIDAILSVSPYYNKPSQQGILKHYESIAAASPVPIILYNVPGRTGSNIAADTTIQLSKNKNIIGIKEASGDICQIMKIMRDKPDDFLVISGDDAMTLPIITLGGAGVISVTANALPLNFSEMVNNALNNNLEKARKQHYQMIDIMAAHFEEGNPAGIKASLANLNIIQNNLRLPLVPVSDRLYKRIESLVKDVKK